MPLSDYFAAKTLTKRATLNFTAEHSLDVVTVLPACVVGRFLVPHLPPSVAIDLALIRAQREYSMLLNNMQFVHVDDVAAAHLFLLECPEARGRYICSAADVTTTSLAGFLRPRFPEFPIPDELVGGEQEPAVHLSSKKLQSLGFVFKHGLEAMFEGAIHCCKQKGFL